MLIQNRRPTDFLVWPSDEPNTAAWSRLSEHTQERERLRARQRRERMQRVRDWLGLTLSTVALIGVGMVIGQARASGDPLEPLCITNCVKEVPHGPIASR